MTAIPFILAALFGISALFHAFALQWPGISVPESPTEHLLFVAVNLWFCDEVASRDSWSTARLGRFYVALGALTVHQVVVHGYLLWQNPSAPQNYVVLAGMVVAWVLTVIAVRR